MHVLKLSMFVCCGLRNICIISNFFVQKLDSHKVEVLFRKLQKSSIRFISSIFSSPWLPGKTRTAFGILLLRHKSLNDHTPYIPMEHFALRMQAYLWFLKFLKYNGRQSLQLSASSPVKPAPSMGLRHPLCLKTFKRGLKPFFLIKQHN